MILQETVDQELLMQKQCLGQSKRNDCLDIIRGLAIFLVVLGHSIQYTTTHGDFFEDKLFQLIYSFHMPLFMLISGYLAYNSVAKRTFWENILGKFKTIVLPMVVWGTVSLITKLFLNIEKFSITGWINSCIGIWFLYSLIINYFALITVDIMPHRILKICTLVLWGGVMCILPQSPTNLYMYPYFCIGACGARLKCNLKWNMLTQKKQAIIFGSLLTIFVILFGFYSKEAFIYTTGMNPFSSHLGVSKQIAVDLYRYTIGFVGSLNVILIVSHCWNISNSHEKHSRVLSVLNKLGKVSLQIYLMQRAMLEFVLNKVYNKIFWDLGLEKWQSFFDIAAPVGMCIFTLVITYYGAILIGRNSRLNSFLFGRK